MYKFVILFLMFSIHGHAEVSSQENLRTFFTSKSVRIQLDDLRSSGKYSKDTNSPHVLNAPLKVKMQGIVIREGKTPVVFVNNQNTLKTHHLSNDVTVRDHKIKKQGYKIPVRVKQQGVTLKPGQQWDESSKKVEDTYRIKQTKDKPDGVADLVKSAIIK